MSTARFRFAWGAILLLAVAAGTAQAQEFRGRVQGIVTDTTGAIVPGVAVVLRNDNTGVEASRTTNKDGWYLFDYVDPGTYTLTAALSGFKTEIRKSVRVQQRADLTVDFKLEVGSLVETVSVTEAPLGLQFTTATRDLTVEQEMVKELPSSTRNPFQLAMLDPMTVNRGSTVETQPYHHRTANEMDIGGGTKYRNDVLLDGTPLTAGNKLGYTPPMDAVTEYTVQQNAIDAEFGHNSGGVAVVTMKSGSNDVHATAYYYGRDASLNAISDRAVQKHSDNPYWNAGATLGLPIIKNKLFAVRGVREDREHPELGGLLHAADARSSARATSRSPTTPTARCASSTTPPPRATGRTASSIRDPFPGNKIPQDRWDPLAAEDHERALGSEQRGRRQVGLQQLQVPAGAEVPLLQLLDPARLEHQRPLEGLRARQPHGDEPGRQRLHERPRSAEAAQHHGQQAQRLERRRRHRLHLQPDHHPEPARLVLPGRGQARLPRHGDRRGGHAVPVAERLVAVVRHGPTADLLALHRRRQHGPRAVRRAELLVPGAPRLQRARAPQQVPDPPHAEGRHGDPLEARRGRALLLHAVPVRLAGDRQRLGEPEHQDRQPVGELPARGAGQRDARLGRRRQLARPVHAVPDRQHGDVRLLRPGRLPGHP